MVSRRTTGGRIQKTIIFYCQHVGTGVLLATAFVHLLPTAFESLTDPCLPYFFSEAYKPFPGLISMVAAIVVVGVESYLTARGAGHSHSRTHDLWDEEDDDRNGTLQIPLQDGAGMSSRRADSRRPADIDVEQDPEASDALVADVSPPATSTPLGQENAAKRMSRGSEDSQQGGDSDLDFDEAELHESTPPSSGNNNEQIPPSPRDTGAQEVVVPTADENRKQLLQCLLLEAGILFHSIFIGMAVSVATGPAFVVFLVAICFHQSFEGLALGSRIAAIQFPKTSVRPWLMVLAYGITTPVGQAIGLIVHRLYDPQSMGGLLVVGFMNAISSGLLLYAGLVQLLAEDFLTESSYRTLRGHKRLRAYVAVWVGALLMAAVGAFA